jgi:hypothetical protein
VVDRLLNSPAYGERRGRHWLDVVRCADYYQANPHEHPFANAFELFEAYRYRDRVVGAFNRDMPFDQFLTHQVAGDLLPGPRGESVYPEGLVASGFLVVGSWGHADADKKKIVSDIVDDQIDVVGKAFLGLTLSCARCHDHKFDPFSQADYYGLAGMFYSTRVLAGLGAQGSHTIIQRVPLASPESVRDYGRQVERLRRRQGEIRRLTAELAAAMAPAQPHLRSEAAPDARERSTPAVQQAEAGADQNRQSPGFAVAVPQARPERHRGEPAPPPARPPRR